MSNWYVQTGKDSDIVISSRIRLARNIKGIPFTTKCKPEDLEKVINIMNNGENLDNVVEINSYSTFGEDGKGWHCNEV